jgi:hypothetical protein
MGMGGVALAQLLANAGELEAAPAGDAPAGDDRDRAVRPLAPRPPPLPARARRVLHLFMNGGPSHIDTIDPKPALARYAGKPLPFTLRTERKTGAAWPSPFAFSRQGRSGLAASELFAKVAAHADELCVIRSMVTDVPNHEPSLMLMNCGDGRMVRPSLGSWVTYGLGSESQNLPGFVVLCPGGVPLEGVQNWRAGFLPQAYQGTHLDTREVEVDRLIEHVRNHGVATPAQRRQLDLLARLGRRYQEPRRDDGRLEARLQSFELAFRMQAEATDAFDLSREPAAARARYGDDVQGRQMLMARRLLERGVRFVQVWHGGGQPWDSHTDLAGEHARLARACDGPIAALLADLRASGLLDETLVIWGGEFGRTPNVEIGDAKGAIKSPGRDHNPYGFTVWLAGGGARRGHVHGATDELGFRAVDKPVHVHDLHATILHLLGFDHERFTYRYAGRDFRLTDVHGHVVREIVT